MIKLKKLLKENYWNERKFGEPLPTLRLEQDEPEHFGGGENIKILDYQTEHFDICRSAVILYQRLVKDVDNTDAQDLIVSSAKQLDHLFEMFGFSVVIPEFLSFVVICLYSFLFDKAHSCNVIFFKPSQFFL